MGFNYLGRITDISSYVAARNTKYGKSYRSYLRAHGSADGQVKFILTLVICNATWGPKFEWPQKFDSLYDYARMGYKEAELRIADFGDTYLNKNRTAILFKCKEIIET